MFGDVQDCDVVVGYILACTCSVQVYLELDLEMVEREARETVVFVLRTLVSVCLLWSVKLQWMSVNGVDRVICVVRDVTEGNEQEVVVCVPGCVSVNGLGSAGVGNS